MSLESNLVKSGLSEKEAKVYLAVLDLGAASVLEISKKTYLKRTSIYEIMPALIKRGLISQTLERKRLRFVAESATSLYRQKNLELDILGQLLPSLEAFRNKKPNKPSIKWFEGKEALQKVFVDMVRETSLNDTILALEGKFGETLKHLGGDFFKGVLKEKKMRGLRSKTILAMTRAEFELATRAVPWSVDHQISIRLIADHVNQVGVNWYLYQNKLAFIVPGQLLALVIENQLFKESLNFVFENMWKNAEAINLTK